MQNRVAKYSKPNSSNLQKRTYYIRDAQGNVMATYSAWVTDNSGTITWDSLRLSEQHIYGSSRVGMALTNVKLYPLFPKNPHLPDTSHYPIFEGWKRYEITNHLGNVLAVITDRKRGQAASGNDIQWFEADLMASQQYYPFGMLMPGNASASLRRQYSLNNYDYRYGFNGKEGDDEVKGDDNQQDYGMRIYDPRVGRFLSVDPIAREYPELTPYQFASNTPIMAIDLDGLEMTTITETKEIRLTIVVLNNSRELNNESKHGEEFLNKLKDQVIQDFEKTFSGENSTGDTWIAKIDEIRIISDNTSAGDLSTLGDNTIVVSLYDKRIKADKDGTMNYTGAHTERNTPCNGTIPVVYVIKRIDQFGQEELLKNSVELISRNIIHELGHKANLGHPWDTDDPVASDMLQSQNYNANTDSAPKDIKTNIMNSAENPKPNLQTINGRTMTPGQRQIVVDSLPEGGN